MPIRIASPTRIEAAGNKPKLIDEYVGRVNSGTGQVSVARMRSPGRVAGAGADARVRRVHDCSERDARVEYSKGTFDIRAGEAVITRSGEWIRYSTPEPEGAEYIAVCLPAFSPATVHRDE